LTDPRSKLARVCDAAQNLWLFMAFTGIFPQFDFDETSAAVFANIIGWIAITFSIMLDMVFLKGYTQAANAILPIVEPYELLGENK